MFRLLLFLIVNILCIVTAYDVPIGTDMLAPGSSSSIGHVEKPLTELLSSLLSKETPTVCTTDPYTNYASQTAKLCATATVQGNTSYFIRRTNWGTPTSGLFEFTSYSKELSVGVRASSFHGLSAEIHMTDGSVDYISTVFTKGKSAGTKPWQSSTRYYDTNGKKVSYVDFYSVFNEVTGFFWYANITFKKIKEETVKFTLGNTTQVSFKYLLMATTVNDHGLKAAKTIFDAVGAPYDVITFVDPATGNLLYPNQALNLTNSDGSAKYAGLVMTVHNLPYEFSTGWASSISMAQSQQIQNYQIQFGVKIAYLYAYPNSDMGAQPVLGGNANSFTITLATSALQFAIGNPPSMSIPVQGIWNYPAAITNASLAQPAIYFSFDGVTKYVGGVFVQQPTGEKQLYLFLDQGDWSLHSKILSQIWFHWLTNKIYLGMRRIYLNGQLDDFFLDTSMYDPNLPLPAQGASDTRYRATPDDLRHLEDWQTALNAKLPAGSKFVAEFAYNGFGVASGEFAPDDLFDQSKISANSFFWLSHTYDHGILNNMNYSEVYYEVMENVMWTFGAFLPESAKQTVFSPHSMVPPGISGLFNPQALRAMNDTGIWSVVGDNSIAAYRPANPYHGLYTTTETNGFPGILILPRQPTNIYYYCSTPEDQELSFNATYFSYFGEFWPLEKILDLESNVSVALLTAYRPDLYMFHQANIRFFQYNGKLTSLYSMWVDAVLNKLLKYSTLPVLSKRQDDMATIFKQRMQRDHCEITGTLHLKNNTLVAVTVSSKYDCTAAITGLKLGACSWCPATKEEVYGPDITTFVELKANTPVMLPLKTPINWNM